MFKYIYIILLSLILFSTSFPQSDFFGSSSSIGGYGELHYNKSIIDEKTSNILDFHRFVIFYGYQFDEKWSFKAEVEIEHNFVASGEGELELEQAFVDYHHNENFGFQAGVILPSVGLINEYHEPPLFFGVERPDYSKSIVPTTWFGNGISIYGMIKGFEYKISLMEGLLADKISLKDGIRGARQKGFKSNADNLLYNTRIDYLGIRGLRVGLSYTYNNATGDSVNIPVTLIEGHLQLSYNNIYVVGEAGSISYDKGDLKKSFGYYFDLGYDMKDIFEISTQIIPFVRISNYNTAAETSLKGDTEKMFGNSQWMVGLNVLPIPQVVFKVDYSEVKNEFTDRKTKLFNLGVGYMF